MYASSPDVGAKSEGEYHLSYFQVYIYQMCVCTCNFAKYKQWVGWIHVPTTAVRELTIFSKLTVSQLYSARLPPVANNITCEQ